MKKIILMILSSIIPIANLFALPAHSIDSMKWSALLYGGRSCKEPLVRILKGDFTSVNETLISGELAYQLSPDNLIRRFFSPIVSTVQAAGNIAWRNGDHNGGVIWEFDPYLIFRWEHFPWDRYIGTTLAVGEGLSYVTRVPWVEINYNDDVAHLLNYLMFEATFALPSHPQWQWVVRIHHRSGAFGLYGAGNTGSNTVGLGIRYCFS